MRGLRKFLLTTLVVALSGCAHVQIEEYEWQGSAGLPPAGGVMRIEHGLEVWIRGAPLRDYEPLKYIITGLDRARRSDESVFVELRKRVRELGGDGYMVLDTNKETLGSVSYGSASVYGSSLSGVAVSRAIKRNVYTVLVFRYREGTRK
jgi:hypothetical protein